MTRVHQIGGNESTGSTNAKTAVNQHFFTGINAFRHPGQGRFQILQSRGFFIRDGHVINIKSGILFADMQIVTFSAQVDNGGDSLGANGCQVIMGSGGKPDGQLGGYPSDRIFLHFRGPFAAAEFDKQHSLNISR